MFEAHGQVDRVSIMTDRDTGRSRGFGFVEMTNAEEGDKAIAALNGTQVGGRTLNVNEARPKVERGGGGGGGGRGTAADAAAAVVVEVATSHFSRSADAAFQFPDNQAGPRAPSAGTRGPPWRSGSKTVTRDPNLALQDIAHFTNKHKNT